VGPSGQFSRGDANTRARTGALIGIAPAFLDGAVVERERKIRLRGRLWLRVHRIPADTGAGHSCRVFRPLTERRREGIARTSDRYASLK